PGKTALGDLAPHRDLKHIVFIVNPSIGRIRCLIRRWSCSTRLFKYWHDRTFTRRGSSPVSFISRTARCDAAYAASVILVGVRRFFIALRRKVLAAVTSRFRLRKKIHRPSGLVHGPIQVDPTAPNLYICLVHPPGSPNRTIIATPALLEFRQV